MIKTMVMKNKIKVRIQYEDKRTVGGFDFSDDITGKD